MINYAIRIEAKNFKVSFKNYKNDIVFRLNVDFDAYRERAKKCVKESLSEAFNPPVTEDPHYITFSPYVNEIHDPIKQEIYEPKASYFEPQ